MTASSPGKKQDILTVILEDYFHVGALSSLISPTQWNRFEPRYEKNTLATLDLLAEFDVKATFFVLGWIAERRPDLIAEVANRGHEIANYGFLHRDVRQFSREEFRDDARRSRDVLEAAIGRPVVGYRIPQGLRTQADLWTLDVLAEEGYLYDSSIIPTSELNLRSQERVAHKRTCAEHELWEFPYATINCGGYLLPISGGNYFRQIPHSLLKYGVAHWKKNVAAPYMMYFHVWELDPDQPRITAASFLAHARQYRKLGKMSWVLRDYLRQYQFGSIADCLGHDTGLAALSAQHIPARPKTEPITVQTAPVTDEQVPISVVVPCCNERTALPYLANTLDSVAKLLEHDYEVSFIFVDDGSIDNTWELLNRLFGNKKNCQLLQHPQNRGVTAAILTGIRHAESEIVCSIDCDCTYDPHDLLPMLRMLTDDVDLVTASPYHAQGKVINVPGWRLSLSRGASWLYGKVLRHKLSTYTSCFRVYRRSKVVDLQPSDLGFLGVTEILGLLDLGGAHIVEFPATLQVRILGYSKMKVARTVLGHLKNLWQLRQLRKLIDRNRELVFPFAGPPLAVTKRIGTRTVRAAEKKETL